MTDALARLREVVGPMPCVAVAVSGGVDSLTLATVAHDLLGEAATMHHAISPAVPAEATRRTRDLATARRWVLDVFDAGEFEDARYRANPVNRCYFCKVNLYAAIARRTEATILSGTNLDDLGEYRPGLDAAVEYGVRHPFLEAGIDKRTLRRIAADLGLGEIADLPASPCLSSRVETGIAIEAPSLALIETAEHLLRDTLSPRTVRCRVRARGIVIELDPETLQQLDPSTEARLRLKVGAIATAAGLAAPISFAAYRNGSAFIRAVE